MEGEARRGRAAVIPWGALRNGPFGSGSPGLEQSKTMTVGRKCWKLEPGGKATPLGSPCAPQRAAPLLPGHAGVTGPFCPSESRRSGLGCAGPPGPRLAGAVRLARSPGGLPPGRRHRARGGQDRGLLGAEPPVLSSKGSSAFLLPPSPVASPYNARLKPVSKCAYFKNLILLRISRGKAPCESSLMWERKERDALFCHR